MAGDVKNYLGGKPIVILGTDGTDLYGITVDIAGHLQVDVLSNALPTGAATEATQGSILAQLDAKTSTLAAESGGNLASIKTAIEKIDDIALETNKLFGFNDRYAETVSNLDPGAGAITLDTTAVPAGEVWIVQCVEAYNDARGVRMLAVLRTSTTSEASVFDITTTVAGGRAIANGQWVLKAGDCVRFYFLTTTAGDDLYGHLWGYKMKVA